MTSADFWWIAVFITGLFLGLGVFCVMLVYKWGKEKKHDCGGSCDWRKPESLPGGSDPNTQQK